jgi:hypothetical protein
LFNLEFDPGSRPIYDTQHRLPSSAGPPGVSSKSPDALNLRRLRIHVNNGARSPEAFQIHVFHRGFWAGLGMLRASPMESSGLVASATTKDSYENPGK